MQQAPAAGAPTVTPMLLRAARELGHSVGGGSLTAADARAAHTNAALRSHPVDGHAAAGINATSLT